MPKRIDCLTYWHEAHPAKQSGSTGYLVVPQDCRSAVQCLAFLQEAQPWSRVLGGLLPFFELESSVIAEVLKDRWWRGLFLAPNAHQRQLADPAILEELQRPECTHLPIVVECGREDFSRPRHLRVFLEQLPQRPVVLTHGGQLNISGGHLEEARQVFLDFPHTYLESSGIYRQDWLESMLEELGPARLLYGSSHPWFHEALEFERVRILPLEDDGRETIWGGTAAQLFGLDRRAQ